MTVGESYSYPTVVPIWAAPLSHPDRHLSLANAKGEEILNLETLDQLPAESRQAVQIELKRRYLTAQIHRINSAKVEFGATYWSVETERGHREFVTQSLQENAQWLTSTQLLLIDIDGNRFEIPDVEQLDPTSLQLLETVI